jgi:putative transposase
MVRAFLAEFSMKKESHRKRVKHYHQPGDMHELTFSCYHRMALLTNDDWRRRLSKHIQAAGDEHFCELVAFVLMPEHVHILMYPTLAEPDIQRYLGRIKQPFTAEIHELLEQCHSPLLRKLMVRVRPGKTCFQFWQEGPGFDRNLFSPSAIRASIDYIHNNPVERKLCQRAVDWKWSSARYYLGEPPRQQHVDLPFIHGLPPGALDQAPNR